MKYLTLQFLLGVAVILAVVAVWADDIANELEQEQP